MEMFSESSETSNAGCFNLGQIQGSCQPHIGNCIAISIFHPHFQGTKQYQIYSGWSVGGTDRDKAFEKLCISQFNDNYEISQARI